MSTARSKVPPRPPLRFKWHRLKRRRDEPSFQRAALREGLVAAAPLEVDIRATADGHWVCLHDPMLDRETTGTGTVASRSRVELEALRQRGEDGAILDDPPLFLDEIADAVRAVASWPPGLVQLDVKEALGSLDPEKLARFREALRGIETAFTIGGTDAALVERLAATVPGVRKGFDPLHWHEKAMPSDAAGFRALAGATLAAMPDADVFYLRADLVLAAAEHGVELPRLVAARGALVDSWTIDADRPDLLATLERLAALGCRQITSNDPLALAALWDEARCS
ncbi:MAG: hypothetical protein NZ555_03645 [Geminicoccaceae bacterium]|nr:hypothetical protein [Geminicoccaceae bacterium]MDW8370653.1 glycerophosphodiester phosphodiesterase family protein [Geminicoccaceae bacterium]